MLYTVYILFSQNHNKIYIGFTSNLIKRFHSHNIRSRKDWTHNFRPWIVIYCEYFDIKTEAMAREKQLKGAKGREWIWDKIESQLNVKDSYLPEADLGSTALPLQIPLLAARVSATLTL